MQGPRIVRNSLAMVLVLGMMIPLSGFAKAAVNSSVASVDATSATASPADTFSENPGVKLPDKVAASIPDNAQFVAKDYVQTTDGKLLSAESGRQVMDPELVGTKDEPADPLAKSNGQKFIPQEVSTVRSEISEKKSDGTSDEKEQSNTSDTGIAGSAARYVEKSSASESAGEYSTTAIALQSNDYGAYWGMYQRTQAFFEKSSNLFVQQAKGVIDVSEWQGDINWDAVKTSGAEGAIIRIGYSKSSVDKKAARNISECKRLGIPFGIYMYSYASDATEGASEGEGTVSRLKNMGVSASDLSYPVYYDLENWVSGGSHAPTNPGVWDGIVNSWWSVMQRAGFDGHLGVYSFTYFLNTALNTSNIHSKTSWVAQYGPSMQFSSFGSNARGWQYWSTGSVNGISGNVDLNAFGNKDFVSSGPYLPGEEMERIPDGKYYINAGVSEFSSIDVPGKSAEDQTQLQIYSGNKSSAQQFIFTRQNDGSYEIKNANSLKVLDVSAAVAKNDARVQQYSANGTVAQHWFLRKTASGGIYIQSALGNWAIDIANASTADYTKLRLWEPNGTKAQVFFMTSVEGPKTGVTSKLISKLNDHMVFDIPGSSKDDLTQVQLYSWNQSDAQLYLFNEVANGVYEIKNYSSGKLLETRYGATENSTVIDQYASNGSQAQRWFIRKNENNTFSFYNRDSGRYIDVPGGNAKEYQGLQIYDGNLSAAQQWVVTPQASIREQTDLFATQNKTQILDGTYSFSSLLNTNQLIEIGGASKDNFAKVQLYRGNGTNAQKWRISHDSLGYVMFANVSSGKVLDVSGGSSEDGGTVQQYTSNSSYAQKWIAVKQPNGIKIYSALRPDLCLDVPGANAADAQSLWTYTSNSTNAQIWQVKKL